VFFVPWSVYQLIQLALLVMAVFALIDAARRRADAFPAVDRQTKKVWLLILGGSVAAQILFPAITGPLAIVGLAGVVATIVYLVDVRRRLIEITRGPRW
jgi:hypothetical protein